jgi:hypothetical protein
MQTEAQIITEMFARMIVSLDRMVEMQEALTVAINHQTAGLHALADAIAANVVEEEPEAVAAAGGEGAAAAAAAAAPSKAQKGYRYLDDVGTDHVGG